VSTGGKVVPLRGKEQAARRAGVLCVLVRIDTLIVAVPADKVTRITLADETVRTPTPNGGLKVRNGDLEVPGWDMCRLLGFQVPITAWLFLAAGGGREPFALGTGPCVAVRPLPPPEPLPFGLFKRAADAMVGAFRVDAGLCDRGAGIAGIWLDPSRLVATAPAAGASPTGDP